MINKVYKKEERVDKLQRLCNDIYDRDAVESLQNKIIDNIENIILEKRPTINFDFGGSI